MEHSLYEVIIRFHDEIFVPIGTAQCPLVMLVEYAKVQ